MALRTRNARSIHCALLTTVFFSFARVAPSAELALEKQLATNDGWREAKWRMPVADVAQAFGKEFQEQKRSNKEKDAAVSIRGKLKTKLSLDGLEYEVKFGFNSADQLNSVYLVCEKAKKESFAEVPQRLSELFGDTHSQDRTYRRVGVAIHLD